MSGTPHFQVLPCSSHCRAHQDFKRESELKVKLKGIKGRIEVKTTISGEKRGNWRLNRSEDLFFFRDHYNFRRKNSEIRNRFAMKTFSLALARVGAKNLNPAPGLKSLGTTALNHRNI